MSYILTAGIAHLSQALGDKGNAEEEEEEEDADEDIEEAEEAWPVQLRCVLEIVNTGKGCHLEYLVPGLLGKVCGPLK